MLRQGAVAYWWRTSHRFFNSSPVSRRILRAGSQLTPSSQVFVKNEASKASRAVKPLDLENPARHYPYARRLKRKIHLHIGPTNSGKSYTALSAFKASRSGYYAGPLRMLAREIYDRMEMENIPCNLVTGDEVLEKEGATLNSGTVEMVDLAHDMDIAVIDEIQMLEDPDRGWAWTRAFLGVRAKTVHLCGDPSSESIVKALTKETGDDLEIHRYERLSPLVVASQSLLHIPTTTTLKNKAAKPKSLYKLIEPGDCVVCFSKRQVQTVRDRIVQAHGNSLCCAIIYGSLPPETRAEQARLFNNNEETKVDYMVASDAIGMGLNLGIKRIIFSGLKKFDGKRMRNLEVSEIKQIAGRAGRYRTSNGSKGESGVVTCLKQDDIAVIKKALASPTPTITRAVLMPPTQVIRSALIGGKDSQGQQISFSTAMKQVFQQSNTGKNYRRPRQSTAIEVATLFDRINNLTFDDRMVLSNAPVPTSSPIVEAAFTKMCSVIAKGRSGNAMELFPELMTWLETGNAVGPTLEVIHKTLTLFLWMSYRFPCNFVDRVGALDLKRLCEAQFDALLNNSRKSLASPGRALTTQSKAMAAGLPTKGPRYSRRKR